MHYLLKGILLTISLYLVGQRAQGAEFESAPISISFGATQLSGETNIWQLAESAEGQIIAAGERVGFYENGTWKFLAEPRAAAIRCLLVDRDTLWVSAQNEIGSITLPLKESSTYRKLDLSALTTAGDIWNLARDQNFLVATTVDMIFFIDLQSGSIRKEYHPNRSRLSLHRVDGSLIITASGIEPKQVALGQTASYKNPLPEKNDLWLGTAPSFIVAREVFKKVGESYQPLTKLTTAGDPFLFTSMSLWGDKLVATTYNKGVLLVDSSSGKTASLGPPTIPSLGAAHSLVDRKGRLWVSGTRGITLMESTVFGRTTFTGDYPLSAYRADGLTINFDDRAVHVGAHGKTEPRPRAFAMVPTSHGVAVGLWGKLQIRGKTIRLVESSVESLAELPDGTLVVAVGERLSLIDPQAGTSRFVEQSLPGIESLAVAGGKLWATTSKFELLRSPLTQPLNFSEVAKLPTKITTRLQRFGNTVVAANNQAILIGERLDPVKNTRALASPQLATTGDGTVWLLGEQDGHIRLGRLRAEGEGALWETVEAKGLTLLGEAHHLSASGETLTISAPNSILELHTPKLEASYRLTAPHLAFAFSDPRIAPAASHSSTPTTLPADHNSLTFTATLPYDEFSERPAYERRLLPTETAWVPTKAGEKVSYPSLSSRSYTLEVRATHLGHTGAVASYAFVVLPPWYASPLAFVTYIALAVALAFALYRLRTRQIRARNLELERIVGERTRELAEASAAKSEFVASMSHEIRNPMNGVIGLVNILREQPSLPKQADYLRKLYHCAEQLRATVDDILDFSRIEARRVAVESTPFDLLDTLEAAAATIDPTGAAITFQSKPPAGTALRGDAAKLRQIFANYLSNALKYGIPPGARVGIILTPATEGRLRLTVSVTSSGPTIEKEKLDQLFESFTRGDDAIERNIRGTGLGLAICKRYAEAMGGEVGAVSTNGETTFYLNVPFALAGAAAPAVLTATAAAARPALPAKALAIEDEDYNRIVLGDILAKMNYSVDWATTGEEALRLARENGYDIILTDYRLPDTNGVELTKKILTFVPDPKPAVFAVTAYSTRERREECLAAGMAGFISKPITLEKLRTTLYSWGEGQLTKISLEAAIRPVRPAVRPPEIERGWAELQDAAALDAHRAAELAHRLNNLCRALHHLDLAEQLELLEGALERNEPTGEFVAAIERLLRT